MTLSLVVVWTAAVMEVEVTSIIAVSMKSHFFLENYLLKLYFGI